MKSKTPDEWADRIAGWLLSDDEFPAWKTDAKDRGAVVDFVKSIQRDAREAALREAAEIAKAHVGDASKSRKGNKVFNLISNEAQQSIRDEERGETSASEMIEKKILALLDK